MLFWEIGNYSVIDIDPDGNNSDKLRCNVKWQGILVGMNKIKMKLFIISFLWLGVSMCNVYGLDTETFLPDVRKDLRGDKEVLNVYAWADYIDPGIFADFEKEFHIKVNVEFFDDENVMFSLIQSEPGRFDITFPSDSMTEWMLKSNLLLKLRRGNIPNVQNLKTRFRGFVNKKWKWYSIPIDWGVTGIAYNTKYVREPVESWSVFWNTNYKGRTALVNDSYEVMSVGLKRLGYPLNPANPGCLEKSFRILKELKPLLREEGFLSYMNIVEKLKNEELWIAQCYNGDVMLINEVNKSIKFVIPKEGSSFWTDNIAIPAGAKKRLLAEKFINFMLRPEIGARQTNYSYYASCNKRAWKFINREIFKESVCLYE